ncbi:MAG: hypothetical protein ACE5GO_01305 [Anaerolineales bacterium]
MSSVNAGAVADSLSIGGSTTISATIRDVAGQTAPDGVTVDFALTGCGNLNGSGTTATAATSSGTASLTYNAAGCSDGNVALIQASVTAPSGVAYSDSAAVFVTGNVSVSSVQTTETSIGPQTIDVLSTVGISVTKRGNGEPIVTLAQYSGNPHPTGSSTYPQSPFVDVHLSSSSSVDSLAITVQYTNETGEASHQLYWWNGSSWGQFSGGTTTVDTAANTVSFTVTGSTSPGLSDLAGTPVVVGNSSPTAARLVDFAARAVAPSWGWAALVGVAGLLAGAGFTGVRRRARQSGHQ